MIPFTQFLRPDGRRRHIEITRPQIVEDAARMIINDGYVFEIEELGTGHVSMEVVHIEREEAVACEICMNGKEVPVAVDKLVLTALSVLEL